jgi:hypothetical protein
MISSHQNDSSPSTTFLGGQPFRRQQITVVRGCTEMSAKVSLVLSPGRLEPSWAPKPWSIEATKIHVYCGGTVTSAITRLLGQPDA